MIRNFALVLALLIGGAAHAQLDLPLAGAVPWWVMRAPIPASVDLDFTNGRYYQTGQALGTAPGALLATTRASIGTDLLPSSASGAAFRTFANNVPRITPGFGLLVEEARTNLFLNSGVPVTQTITLGTGTFTIWVNGAGSLTVAAGTAVGTGFGVATNGTPVTFMVSVGGTAIFTVTGALNVAQVEQGAFGTSYIPTTGTSATRAVDFIVAAIFPGSGPAVTLYSDVLQAPVLGVFNVAVALSDGSFANLHGLYGSSSPGNVAALGNSISANASAGSINSANAYAAGVEVRSAYAVAPNDRVIYSAGIAGGTSATEVPPVGLNAYNIGSFNNGAFPANNYIKRVVYWPNLRVPNSILQNITR